MKPGFLANFKYFKHEAYAIALLELVRKSGAPVHQVIRYLDSIEGALLADNIKNYLEDDPKITKAAVEEAIFAVIEMMSIHDEDAGEPSLLNKIMEVGYSTK